MASSSSDDKGASGLVAGWRGCGVWGRTAGMSSQWTSGPPRTAIVGEDEEEEWNMRMRCDDDVWWWPS